MSKLMVGLRKHTEHELRVIDEIIGDFDDHDPEAIAAYLQNEFSVDQEHTEFLTKLGGAPKLRQFYYEALKYDLTHGTNTTSFISEDDYKKKAKTNPNDFAEPDATEHGVKHRPSLTRSIEIAFKEAAAIFRNHGINPQLASVFDLGCGSAKPVLIARSGELGFMFKRAVGVDYYSAILDVARQNAKEMKLKNVEFVHGNAAKFSDYNGVNVIYMYNPFDESIMRSVAKNIAKYGGKSIVCYNKPLNPDCFASKYGWKLEYEQGGNSDADGNGNGNGNGVKGHDPDRHTMIFSRGLN